MKNPKFWSGLAKKAIKGNGIEKAEALAVLKSDDSEIIKIVDSAYQVRRHFWGIKVHIQIILNAKSGMCSEDCNFCSQSHIAKTPIKKYPLKNKEEIVRAANEAKKINAYRFCIVTSGKSLSTRELNTLVEAVKEIKKTMNIQICISPGALTKEIAQRLKDASVDRINHNLETSENFFPKICTTHTYSDRVETIKIAKSVGLEICSGGIIGLGESDNDVVDLAYALRELDVDSIPINFLNPREGTPLARNNFLTPLKCLRTLAMFRFVNPTKENRFAGGREVNLRMLQPLGLYIANSIFTNGYLTTNGAAFAEDFKMIIDAGLEIKVE